MDMEKLTCVAQAISISENTMEKNDVFVLVKFKILDDLPNLNGQGVTASFIDDMNARQESLIGLPLYCDVDRLLSGQTEKLGHMYDRHSGEFYSTQIGSITSFEKVIEGDVTSLIAVARVPKRECAICDCLIDLYNQNRLKFSFQILYNPEFTVQVDGVIYVDANPANTLTGVAVVSIPANPNSIALEMVAEVENIEIAEATEGVEKQMTIEEMEKALAEKDAELAKVVAEKTELEASVAERDTKIAELESAVAAKKEECAAKDKESCAECKKEATAEEGENPFAKKEEEPEDKEDEKENAECKNAKAEAEIAQLKAELEAAQSAVAELAQIKKAIAEKELADNQEKAKAFAEKQGLDTADENVAKAIAEVDYKAIAEMSMAIAEKTEEKVAVASVVTDGFEIKGDKWADLLAPAK